MPEYMTTVDQLRAAANDTGPRYARVAGISLALVAAVAGFAFGPIFIDYVTGAIDGTFVRVTA